MKKLVDFTIRENRKLNRNTVLLVLHAEEMPAILPGQFVNVRIDHTPTVMLRRPLSVHDVDAAAGLLYLFVKLVGDGTRALGELTPGARVNVLLPLGNSFNIPSSGRHLLVGGGCGMAPLLYLAKALKQQGAEPVLLFGTRSAEDIVQREEYERQGKVYYTTEDGSVGEKGYPTQHPLMQEPFDTIFCCGPEVMMKAVARLAKEKGIPCYVSLENTMACGIGACLCCVTETREGHRCVCTDGPIFNANELSWQI